MKNIKPDRKSLKEFGITMGVVSFAIGAVIFIKHKHYSLPIAALSSAFLLSAFIYPKLLRPVYTIWMGFASILSWVNTRVILFLIFYLVFAPVGIIMRIIGNDLLNRRIDRKAVSYWQDADKTIFNQESYERQF
ncbi:MAG: SxtJ family membrane protein [Candidatus Omnitrophota bacterium]|jgi:hypothetical protein